MNNQKLIMKEVEDRGIEYFVHFTDARNLPSIITDGLLTRETLDWCGIDYSFNDSERIDNVPDSISLSVSFPNYKMFYPITQKYPQRDYCVLFLDAYEVLQYNCAFNETNAANNICRFIPIEERQSYEAFAGMFRDNVNGHSRLEMNLSDCETTDPQAEVLVLDNLPTSCIKFCLFRNIYVYRQYKNLFINTDINVWHDSGFFYARHDYEYWR